MPKKYERFSKEQLQEICSSSSTLTEFGEKLGYSNNGRGIRSAKECIAKFDLDCSTILTYNNIIKGKSPNYNTIDMSKFTDVSEMQDKKPKREHLRKNLIKIRGHRCEECGLEIWNDKPIPLQLHHKDGNGWNNELDNLQLLCPNCHALTNNYCGKNSKNKGIKVTDDELCYAIEHSHSIREAVMMLGLADTVGGLYNRCYRLMAIRNIKLLDK